MSYRPPGTLRVLRVLAWTSLLRLARAASIRRGQRAQRAKKNHGRVATPRKRGDALMLLMLAMLPLFVFQSLVVSSQAVQHLRTAAQDTGGPQDTLVVSSHLLEALRLAAPTSSDAELDKTLSAFNIGEHSHPPRARIIEHFHRRGVDGFEERSEDVLLVGAHGLDGEARRTFANCGALLLLALFAMLLSIGFGGGNTSLAGGDGLQAWLMTFPVATRSLILARALEYSLVQFFPWLVYCPLLLQFLLALGQTWALPIAITSTLLTTLLTGSFRLWVETWLRLHCSLRTLRSVQGVCTLLALVLMTGAFAICLGEAIPQWFVDLGRRMPDWIGALPAAWPMALARGAYAAAVPGALATFAVFALACLCTTRLLAHGVMRSGGVDPGVRGQQGQWARKNPRLGVAGKDLAMLLRDRNFLVQTLVVPVAVIVLQLIVNPGLGRVQGKGVAMLAYGIGVYSLVGGCFQVLSAEGRALWMLYTLPVPIREVLRRKVRIWAATAVGFAFTALVVFSVRTGNVELPRLLADLLFVGAGVFCASHIAAGISILGTDPAADYVPRQPKARHVYLYFFFVGTYFMGLQAPEFAVRTAALLVFGTLAFAIWQRACDRVPWLLDPVDENRSNVGVYDGGAAVMVFFALQALVLLIAVGIGGSDGGPSLQQIFVAFTIGGGITVLLFLLMLSMRGVSLADAFGLRKFSPTREVRCVLAGAAVGLLVGGLGLAYVYVVRRTGWVELPPVPTRNRWMLQLLAVLAAPLVEEILFRGLLFQGLLRSVRLPVAVAWSAGVFAVLHPMTSWLPVFCLGVAAALVFHRTRFLPAAMAVHAVYNLVVVALQ